MKQRLYKAVNFFVFMEEKSDSLHNNLIVLYIIIVVILTVFATWVVLTKAMPVNIQNNGVASTTIGLTIIEPDLQPKNKADFLINSRGGNGI